MAWRRGTETPAEVFLREAKRQGRVKEVKQLSMARLEPTDYRFQCRAKHFTEWWVIRLVEALRLNGKLEPIVVFTTQRESERLSCISSGFHRHEAYMRLGRSTIPAYVVTADWENFDLEGTLYSLKSNQVTGSLPTGRKDMANTMNRYFAIAGSLLKEDKLISSEVGVSIETVVRHKRRYRKQNNLKTPEMVLGENGELRPPARIERFRSRVMTAVSHVALKELLESANVDFSLVEQIRGKSVAALNTLVTADLLLTHIDPLDSRGVAAAIGSLLVVREGRRDPDRRLLIVCRQSSKKKSVQMEIAGRLGIEFVTPEELIAILKPDDSNGPQTGS